MEEDFDQLENKQSFKKMILIIGGIVLVSGALTTYLLLKKAANKSYNSETPSSNTVASSTATTSIKPLYSADLATWKNYYWPGKINTHYPSDWKLQEVKNTDGFTIGLDIMPPTGLAEDTIFIGGDKVKCSSILKYSKNRCLKNKIQVPFYTSTKNPEVLSAFDIIYQNTILTDVVK